MRGFRVTPVTLLTIFTVIVIFLIVTSQIPVIASVLWGPCWSRVHEDIDRMNVAVESISKQSGGNRESIDVSLGDCAAGIVLVNKVDAGSINAILERLKVEEGSDIDVSGREAINPCTGSRAYFVGVPYLTDIDLRYYKIWKAPADQIENVVNAYKEHIRGIVPFCEDVACPECIFDYDTDPIVIDGPGGAGTKNYCVTLSRSGEKIIADIKEDKC